VEKGTVKDWQDHMEVCSRDQSGPKVGVFQAKDRILPGPRLICSRAQAGSVPFKQGTAAKDERFLF